MYHVRYKRQFLPRNTQEAYDNARRQNIKRYILMCESLKITLCAFSYSKRTGRKALPINKERGMVRNDKRH